MNNKTLKWLIALGVAVFSLNLYSQSLADSPDAWLTFQHDPQHTGRTTVVGPKTSNVKWTFSLPDDINGGAAIASDGTIYLPLGGNGGYFYAFNPDGSIRWVFPLTRGSSTVPAIGSDGTIYLGSRDDQGRGIIIAVNPDGTQKWVHIFLDATYAGIESSPAIGEDGTIYVTALVMFPNPLGGTKLFDALYALNPDGTQKWQYIEQIGDAVYARSSPAIGLDGTIYFGTANGLFAMNTDGTEKWHFGTGFSSGLYVFEQSAPAIDQNGIIYIASYNGTVFAISSTGNELWRNRLTLAEIRTTPALAVDGTIYVGTYGGGSGQGSLFALNPDGTIRWSYNADRIWTSPLIDLDGTIYFGTDDGRTFYALNPDGTLLWNYVTGCIQGSAAIGPDGTLYVSGVACPFPPGKTFYAFGVAVPSPTPSWTNTSTSTPTETATYTPTHTATSTPTNTLTSTATPRNPNKPPTNTPKPTRTPKR